MKTYAAYLRCSREEQLKGFSHEYQVSGIQNNPRTVDMKCAGIFKEAVTGTRFDNREQLDLVYNIYEQARGGLDYLLVYRWDRLGRDVGEAFQTIKKFLRIGVELNCPDKWIDFEDPNWPVILGIEFGIAQSESHKISDRTRDGIYQANLQGYHTAKAPVGYKRVDTGKIKPNGKRIRLLTPDDNAPIIQKVLTDYADGLSSKVELFREYGPKLGIRKSAFYELFQNIVYTGQLYLKAYKRNPARVIEAKHEGLISKEVFQRIQDREERDTRPSYSFGKTKAADNFFYLKGLLKCARSGKHMTAYEVKKKNGQSFFYYQTSRSKDGQLINAINAHQIVTRAVYELKISEDLYRATRKVLIDMISAKSSRDRKRQGEIKKEMKKTEERIERVQDSFADGVLSIEDYKVFQDRYKTDLKGLEAELATLKLDHNEELNFRLRVLDFLSSIGDIFRLSDPKRKKILLRAVFPRGFSIEKQNVLTTSLNYYLQPIATTSGNYEYLQIKKGPPVSGSPVSGEKPDKYRTHNRLILEYILFA